MPTTPIYALRYPASTDPADVPTDISKLAIDVETKMDGKAAYGTSLPASPTDGLEAILVDSTTNPSYQWRFRYNAGSSSAYKWEFVGGAPRTGSVDTSENTSSASFVDLATVGPSVALPRAGDYYVVGSAVASPSSGGGIVSSSPSGAGFVATDSFGMWVGGISANLGVMGQGFLAGLTAGTIKLQYRNSAGVNTNFQYRRLSVTPVRVS